jgi:hypothetical protein
VLLGNLLVSFAFLFVRTVEMRDKLVYLWLASSHSRLLAGMAFEASAPKALEPLYTHSQQFSDQKQQGHGSVQCAAPHAMAWNHEDYSSLLHKRRAL